VHKYDNLANVDAQSYAELMKKEAEALLQLRAS
jgi:hypothetical protein